MSTIESVHELSFRQKVWLLVKIYFRYTCEAFRDIYRWLFVPKTTATVVGYYCRECGQEFSFRSSWVEHEESHKRYEVPKQIIEPASLLLPTHDLLYRLEVREDASGGMELYIDGEVANNTTLLEIFQEFKKLGYDDPQEIYWYLKGRGRSMRDNQIAYQYILNLARKTATPVHVTLSEPSPPNYPYRASTTYQSYSSYSDNDWRTRSYNDITRLYNGKDY